MVSSAAGWGCRGGSGNSQVQGMCSILPAHASLLLMHPPCSCILAAHASLHDSMIMDSHQPSSGESCACCQPSVAGSSARSQVPHTCRWMQHATSLLLPRLTAHQALVSHPHASHASTHAAPPLPALLTRLRLVQPVGMCCMLPAAAPTDPLHRPSSDPPDPPVTHHPRPLQAAPHAVRGTGRGQGEGGGAHRGGCQEGAGGQAGSRRRAAAGAAGAASGCWPAWCCTTVPSGMPAADLSTGLSTPRLAAWIQPLHPDPTPHLHHPHPHPRRCPSAS
jgi:hypothetical protein